MLEQRALHLEGRHLVVGGLEHVVGATDERQLAVGVTDGDVAGVEEAVAHRRRRAIGVAQVLGHQVDGPLGQVQADLALVARFAGDGVEQRDGDAGQRLAHGSGGHGGSGGVADDRGGLGLPVAVADGEPPRCLDPADDLGVERLAGRDDLAQGTRLRAEVGLQHHPPGGGRGAERVDLGAFELGEQAGRVEACGVVDEDGGLGDPGREEAAPGVLAPAGRTDRQVDVTGADAEPVHGAEVPDRVGRLGVHDHLRLRRGAGREVDQARVGGAGDDPRACLAFRGGLAQVARVLRPAVGVAADHDAREGASDVVVLVCLALVRDDVRHRTPVDTVLQVGGVEHRRRRQDDRAELDHGEHGLPELELVAEHDEDVIALLHAEAVQACGEPIGACGHLGVAQPLFTAVLLDDPERRAAVVGRDDVEPVGRPVERLADVGPPEPGACRFGRVRSEELVAGGTVRVGRVHRRHGPIMPHPPRSGSIRRVPGASGRARGRCSRGRPRPSRHSQPHVQPGSR